MPDDAADTVKIERTILPYNHNAAFESIERRPSAGNGTPAALHHDADRHPESALHRRFPKQGLNRPFAEPNAGGKTWQSHRLT
jgi:hypothetical protein